MNDKRKHKRGYTAHTMIAYTPLTMEDCIKRLQSGHFPIHSRALALETYGDVVRVDIVSPETRRKILLGGGPRTRIDLWQWPEPVWFEGTFTPSDNGLTRIQGQVKQALSLSYRVLVAQFVALAALGIVLLLAFSSQQHPTDTLNAFAIFWGVIMIIVLISFIINKRRAGRLTQALQSWLSNRLDL